MKIFVKNAGTLENIIKEALAETPCAWGEGGVAVTLDRCDDGIRIVSDGKNITLYYSETASLFRALGVIVTRGESAYNITQRLRFKQLGNMIDCSRNGVMRVEQVKRFIRISALMGFNMLQLYTEDTYEIKEEPYFGNSRGRYTEIQLKEIDAYAQQFGMEVIPCIQTLAHLNCVFYWPEYYGLVDNADILNVGLERSLELIENMFKAMKRSLKSRQINIGMDEAHTLGLGKYLDMFGYKKRAEIMKEHLAKVIELCRKYGYEPMMWSDMFFRICSDRDAYDDKVELTQEAIDSVPEGVNLVYWQYSSPVSEFYKAMFEKHAQFNRDYSFAGGSATWVGFAPALGQALNATRAAFEAMSEFSFNTVFNTIWGDDGAETAKFAALPVVAAYAQGAWINDLSDAAIREAMSIVGADFDDFMYMNIFHHMPHATRETEFIHKYLLYGDVLQGIWDASVPDGMNDDFAEAYPILEKSAQSEKWGYIFKPLALLAKVLSVKSELGKQLKKAYDGGDRAELSRLANEVIPQLVADLEEFLKYHRRRWRTENNDFGFEVQDIRIGGLIARLKDASGLVNEYLNGECEKLDELEQERLPIDKNLPVGQTVGNTRWGYIVTSGRLKH